MERSRNDPERLCRAIVKATNKNELNLDSESLKEIKQLCKSNAENVPNAFEALRERLKESHSQVSNKQCDQSTRPVVVVARLLPFWSLCFLFSNLIPPRSPPLPPSL
jgi:hypothetical protein